MKIAVLSESSADEAAVSVLIEGLLGVDFERVFLAEPPTRGWKGVFKAIETTLRHLHYRTDTEGLIVILDSDESPVHRRMSTESEPCDPKCRLCQLREQINAIQSSLRPRQGRGPIRIGLGIAVPAIEAWFLCGNDPHISESTWIQALQSRHFPFSKKGLKEMLYGSSDPVLSWETQRLVEQAQRMVQGDQMALLAQCFPLGFGSLADEVRSWRSSGSLRSGLPQRRRGNVISKNFRRHFLAERAERLGQVQIGEAD